ncbi:MAG: hydrolase [Bacteroidota bacterium]|nr:hydrolase [Bacteroidota bacterium]
MFERFTEALHHAFQQPLPGAASHALLKPYLKISKLIDAPQLLKPRPGAVMALIYPVKEIPHLLFIERPVYDGVHSGQIAFPGGKIEKTDATFLAAALRETQEEVGIDKEEITVVGPLTEVYVLASNFLVYPFVGYLKEKPKMILEAKEVANTLEVPLFKFFEHDVLKEKPIKNALGFTLMAPYYDINGKVLWGATAMMVSELCSILKEGNIILT